MKRRPRQPPPGRARAYCMRLDPAAWNALRTPSGEYLRHPRAGRVRVLAMVREPDGIRVMWRHLCSR